MEEILRVLIIIRTAKIAFLNLRNVVIFKGW